MSEPVVPRSVDPAGCTPEERARAVAALLATGLVHLASALRRAIPPPVPRAENPTESEANRLAEPPETSVTVSAG